MSSTTVISAGRSLEPSGTLTSRGITQLLVARMCFMVSGYLVSIVLARGLGPLEYGIYGVVVSVLGWIEMVGSAGIPGATAKLIPQYENNAHAVEQTARLLLWVLSLLLFSLGWSFAPIFASLLDIPEGRTLFRLAILNIPFSCMYFAYQGILNGHRRYGSQSICFITHSSTRLIGIVVLFVLGLSVAGALIVNVLATVGVLVYLVLKFPPRGLRLSYALLHPMFRLAIPMGIYIVSLQLLLSLDLWSLKGFGATSGEVVGIYVASLNVARVVTIIPPVLSGVLFASLSWALAHSDEVAARRFVQGAGRFAFIVLFPSYVLLVLHARAVMAFLYSGVYATGDIYLSLQLLAFSLLSFLDIFFNALMVAGKHKQVASIMAVLIPIALMFNWKLIPQLGAIGAATALVLTMCLATTLAAILAHQRFGSLIRMLTVVRVILATVIMTLLGAYLPRVGLWLPLKLVGLLGVYMLVLGLLKELKWADIKALTPW